MWSMDDHEWLTTKTAAVFRHIENVEIDGQTLGSRLDLPTVFDTVRMATTAGDQTLAMLVIARTTGALQVLSGRVTLEGYDEAVRDLETVLCAVAKVDDLAA